MARSLVLRSTLLIWALACADPTATDTDPNDTHTGTPQPTQVDPPPELALLTINEFMASNQGSLELKDKSTPDWIELHNGGDTELDLGGYFLSDNAGDRARARIPDGEVIPAGGFALFYASGDALLGPQHLGFGLSASKGEEIVLTDPWGRQLDWIVFGPQSADVSTARRIDGDRDSGWKQTLQGTPGTTNNP